MNAPDSLFRREALEAKKVSWMGEILLARPVSLAVLVCAALAIFFLLVLFIATGEYTRKERVVGQVQPSRGAARLYSPAPGRIVEKLVHEGQFVRQGQTLYVISIERITSEGGAQHGVAAQIAAQVADLRRELAELDQEAVMNEAQRQIVVAAVRDGWATAVLGEVGQTVATDIPLMSVLPPDGRLEAHLYVPSRAIGFLQRGQVVRLRYDAFPYQKFGQHQGRVEAISNVALAPGELRLLDVAPEMLYRVKVRLDSTSITAYGKQYPLQEGMKFEADVLLDTRKLYEWLLEPLYSITGKL